MKEETLLNKVEDSTQQTEIKVDFPVDNTVQKVDLYSVTHPETVKKEPVEKFIEKYTKTAVNVRVAPNGKIVKVLIQGTKVKVKEEKDGWSLLDDGNYIMSSLLG